MNRSLSYQRLLKLKKADLDDKRLHISTLEDKREVADQKLASLKSERMQALQDASKTPMSGLMLQGYLKKNDRFQRFTGYEIRQLQDDIDQAYAELYPLFQDYKSLEILKEQMLHQQKKEIDAQEQKEQDEMGQASKSIL